MPKKEKKRYAYTDFQTNENGFTFITMFLIIIVLAVSFPLLGYMIQTADYENNYQEISIQQFFQFVRDEVIKSTNTRVTDKKLILEQHPNVTATLELYGSLVRRQVNGQGHEVYVRDVKELHFTPLPYGFQVSVTSISGENHEKIILHYD